MAVVHQSVPIPARLNANDGDDVKFEHFKHVLEDPKTTVSELFAMLRLWEPLVQEKVGAVAYHMINKGATVHDRDALTDLTILHFVCKSGAAGVGNDRGAADVARDLLKQGADVNATSCWTNMTPLHYAAFFGSAAVIDVLAKESKGNLDTAVRSAEFDGGTPLHLAAMAGSAEAVSMLLRHGADALETDDNGRTPLECAQIIAQSPGDDTPDDTWEEITTALKNAIKKSKQLGYRTPSKAPKSISRSTARMTTPSRGTRTSQIPTPSRNHSSGETANVGDKVVVQGGHHGVVRFRGSVSFDKQGDWIGVQLDGPYGKNNGSVAGVQYFRCKIDHGLFVRPKNCSVTSRGIATSTPSRRPRSVAASPSTPNASSYMIPRPASASRSRNVSTPSTTSKRTPGSSKKKAPTPGSSGFGVGSKVFVSGKLCTVHYIGSIAVAPGTFIGIELPDPSGKNDGSLEGERYFSVRPNHGLFVKPDRCTWRGFKVSTLL